MNKYRKPTGWRYHSIEHSMAARGQKSKVDEHHIGLHARKSSDGFFVIAIFPGIPEHREEFVFKTKKARTSFINAARKKYKGEGVTYVTLQA